MNVLPEHQQNELARTGFSTSARLPNERAVDVCIAIEKKVVSYPASVREEVILAVDSIRSFEHVQPEVLAALAQPPFDKIAAASGFKSVWLVGPFADHAHRLG